MRKSAMGRWLFKEEPEHYSFDDLMRDGASLWSGVKNNLARQHLRQVCRGDRILYYHTGRERAIVGEMQAVNDAIRDPESKDSKSVTVKVKPIRRLGPLPLARIKSDAVLVDWDLVRLPRLSVMAVSISQWNRIEELCRLKD